MSVDLLKSEAARLKLGIAWGWVPVSSAVAWADAIITARDAPPAAVLDISLGGQLSAGQMAALLEAVPGAHDEAAALRGTLQDLRRWIGDDFSRSEQAAHWLYAAAASGDLNAVALGIDVYGLEDAFSLARSGQWGTLAEAHARVISDLDGAA
jgi:hypothetical protein